MSIIVLMFGLFLTLLCLVGVASMKYPPGIPFTRSNSRAVAAACHNPPGERAKLGNVKWGDVGIVDEKGVRHCTFSDGEVSMPQDGILYA